MAASPDSLRRFCLRSPPVSGFDSYTVRLDAFEGPMDLLLYLIRKDEVDLHNIPIASITEQYIRYVRELEVVGHHRIDIDTAGEFLVMAATLMEIKSRMLMPQEAPPATEGETRIRHREDPRAELVRQLLEYKKYRDAANALESRAEEWRRRYPAVRAGVDDVRLQSALDAAPDMELEDLDLIDLVDAFRKIAETVIFDRLGDHQVTYDDTPIELHAEDIVSRLRADSEAKSMSLQQMFEGRSRGEMVGLFLALLELVRNRRVRVVQDRIEGLISVQLRDDPEDPGHDQAAPKVEPAADE
jgi:segregation and condensation protein A